MLRELSVLVHRRPGRDHPSPDPFLGDSLPGRLFSEMVHGGLDEEAAVAAVFGPAGNRDLINKVRHQLTNHLVGMLLALPDPPGSPASESTASPHASTRNLAAAQRLESLGAHDLSQYFLERALRQAERYRHTDVALAALRQLIHRCILNREPLAKLTALRDKLSQLEALRDLEYRAEAGYLGMIQTYRRERGKQYTDGSQRATALADELAAHPLGGSTGQLVYYEGFLRLIGHLMDFRFREGFHLGIRVAEQLADSPSPKLAVPLYRLCLVCCIQLRDLAAGEDLLQRLLRGATPPGSGAWLYAGELGVKLYIYGGDYERAGAFFTELTAHRPRSSSPPDGDYLRERLELLGMYLHFLRATGRMPAANSALPARVSLTRFRNDTQRLEAQASPYRIPAFVAQYIYYLIHRQFRDYEDRLESLRSFRFRTERVATSRRTAIFLKMLALIPEAGFSLPRLRPRVSALERELAQLRDEPQPHEIEIIPYETLWTLVEECLQHKTAPR